MQSYVEDSDTTIKIENVELKKVDQTYLGQWIAMETLKENIKQEIPLG